MTHHFSDVTRLTSTSKPVLPSDDSRRSDTFAKHFAKHFPRDATPQQLRENIDLDVLWQGNPLSCVKTFKTPKCRLCTMERLFILKLTASKKISLVNSRSEIYGACRQNPKFHRFSTDDPPGEKVEINTNVQVRRPLLTANSNVPITPFSNRESLDNPLRYCQTITV